jgi:hypothetical protein
LPLPIADFLAGALLTLLLPVTLLISLVLWYWWYSVRVHDASRSERGTAPAAGSPGPSVQETLPPEPDA